jgi:hypothetical protein
MIAIKKPIVAKIKGSFRNPSRVESTENIGATGNIASISISNGMILRIKDSPKFMSKICL